MAGGVVGKDPWKSDAGEGGGEGFDEEASRKEEAISLLRGMIAAASVLKEAAESMEKEDKAFWDGIEASPPVAEASANPKPRVAEQASVEPAPALEEDLAAATEALPSPKKAASQEELHALLSGRSKRREKG